MSLIKIKINLATILRGEGVEREKSLAFEIYINDTCCYKECYGILSSDQVGNPIRAELLAISRALSKCSTLAKELEKSTIEITLKEADALYLFTLIDDNKVRSVVGTDLHLARKIKPSLDILKSHGCIIETSYIDTYQQSIIALAELGVNTLDSTVTLDIIDSTLVKLKEVSNPIKVQTEGPIKTSSTLNDGFLSQLNDELNRISSRTNEIDEEMLELTKKLEFLETYETSLTNYNLDIKNENEELYKEMMWLITDIAGFELELAEYEPKLANNETALLDLNSAIKQLNKELQSSKNNDNAMIDYLQAEIEKLIIQTGIISM